MADYIILGKLTAEGAKAVTQVAQQMKAASDSPPDPGIKIVAMYMLFGHYDWVALVEAPNDEAMAKLSLQLVANGMLTTETVRAFTMDQCLTLAP